MLRRNGNFNIPSLWIFVFSLYFRAHFALGGKGTFPQQSFLVRHIPRSSSLEVKVFRIAENGEAISHAGTLFNNKLPRLLTRRTCFRREPSCLCKCLDAKPFCPELLLARMLVPFPHIFYFSSHNNTSPFTHHSRLHLLQLNYNHS